MSDYEIRDDLPLPPYTGGRRATNYPLGDLKVGQHIRVAWAKKSFLAKKVRKFLEDNPDWELEGRAIELNQTYGFWCVKRTDAPAVQADTIPRASERRSSRLDVKAPLPSAAAPTAHQQKLREAAKLQPTGKARQHVAR